MTIQFHEMVVNLAAHPLMWGTARLARRVSSVWKVPGLGVLISDADCAREILCRDDDFTKNGPGSFAQALTAGLGEIALGNMDGDEHRRLRAAISNVLTPARADTLVRARAADLESMCTRLAQGECVDMAHFVRGWSGRIAFDVLGISPPLGREDEASQDIVRLSGRMASVLGFRRPSRRRARIARADCARLGAYFRDGYEQPAPPGSLAERLQTFALTYEQAIGVLLIFAIGGTLTISAALPRILALLVDNELFNRLTRDPDCVSRAVDEGLRFVTPLPGTVRIVRQNCVVQGHRFSAGSRLVILTSNLARDAKLFPDPDDFDIGRTHDPHAGRLWFGAGPHRCAGFNLAQHELKTALGRVADTAGNLRIVRRRASFGALLPSYSQLVVQAVNRRSR